jgi:hypothetical protein
MVLSPMKEKAENSWRSVIDRLASPKPGLQRLCNRCVETESSYLFLRLDYTITLQYELMSNAKWSVCSHERRDPASLMQSRSSCARTGGLAETGGNSSIQSCLGLDRIDRIRNEEKTRF